MWVFFLFILTYIFFVSQNAKGMANGTYGSDNQVPIFMDEVTCTGSETHIAQCQLPQGWALHDCTHAEDAGVQCHFGKFYYTVTAVVTGV